MQQEIKFRYTYRRKSDGHIYQTIYPLACIEDINGQFATMRDNKLWEVVGRDLYFGTDKNGMDVYVNDLIYCLYDNDVMGAAEKVEFKNGACWLRHRDISIAQWLNHEDSMTDIEVYGNIYEPIN